MKQQVPLGSINVWLYLLSFLLLPFSANGTTLEQDVKIGIVPAISSAGNFEVMGSAGRENEPDKWKNIAGKRCSWKGGTLWTFEYIQVLPENPVPLKRLYGFNKYVDNQQVLLFEQYDDGKGKNGKKALNVLLTGICPKPGALTFYLRYDDSKAGKFLPIERDNFHLALDDEHLVPNSIQTVLITTENWTGRVTGEDLRVELHFTMSDDTNDGYKGDGGSDDEPEGENALKQQLENALAEYRRAGQEKETIGKLEAIKRNIEASDLTDFPIYLEVVNSLAVVYLNDKKHEKAIDLFKRLIALDSHFDYPDARVNYALAFYGKNRRIDKPVEKALDAYINRAADADYEKMQLAKRLKSMAGGSTGVNVSIKRFYNSRYVENLVNNQISVSEKNILHFWATDCPPCIHELPKLLEYAAKNNDINFYIVSIDHISDQEKMKSFLRKSFDWAGMTTIGSHVHFYLDDKRLLYKYFLSRREVKNRLLPFSMFLRGDARFRTRIGPENWELLRKEDIW